MTDHVSDDTMTPDELEAWLVELDSEHVNGSSPAEESTSMLNRLLWGRQICDLPPRAPLIAKYLNRDSLAVIFGAPKAGKSFAVLDIGLSIATGTWWHGHETSAGVVLYIVGEGASGVGPRLEAWLTHQRLHNDPTRMVTHPGAVNLLDTRQVADLLITVDELQPALVIIDTLNRSMPGTDEGSADMGRAVQVADAVRRINGACVLIVHHSGKDSSKGSRGHSALLGAIDTELELANTGDGLVTLRTTAQRDMPEAPPMRLALVPVGESMVIADRSAAALDATELPAGVAETLEALVAIDVPGGVSTTTWRSTVDKPDRTFFRHRSGLLEQGLVVNVGTEKSPRYRPAPEGVLPLANGSTSDEGTATGSEL